MKTHSIFLKSFFSALGVLLYVSGIALLGFNSQYIFGKEDNFLMPIFALLLFIVSACVTSLLVLGKPIYLYLEDRKKEAFTLLFSTLGWLVFFLLVLIIILISVK